MKIPICPPPTLTIRRRGFLSLLAGTVASQALGTTMAHADAAEPKPTQMKGTVMSIRDLYPLITTPALFEARDFYVRHFEFAVSFQASWFVYLAAPGQADSRGAVLAFMHPDHPSVPPGPETFDGKGIILTLEVDDASAVHDRLSAGGAPILHPLTDEPWGQRRFMTRDPAGVMVDVVQQTQPAAGFWDRYPAPNG